MQTPSTQRDLIAAALALRSGPDADAARITGAVVSALQEIEAALAPIVGLRGVAALCKRSLFLTSAAHPWLAGTHEGMQETIDLAPLKAALAQQTSGDAAAGGTALLVTFNELLASLVGGALTERLLRSVWAHSSSGEPAQDTSPWTT